MSVYFMQCCCGAHTSVHVLVHHCMALTQDSDTVLREAVCGSLHHIIHAPVNVCAKPPF